MEYRFNINKILPERINKITHSLLPDGFRGDRREYNECQRLITRILDDIGEASAKAQNLHRTITSATKLRDTDQIVYLMVDAQGNNGLGSVVGLLKTGSKSLYMFDENGYHYHLKPRCILDFYIHETRQRKGLGIELYRYMLAHENLRPIKLAIDRPSDKLLAFLMKHFGFSLKIPQNNKFVVFKGFFDDENRKSNNQINNKYSGPYPPNEQELERASEDCLSLKNKSNVGKPVQQSSYGRYAASHSYGTMADIIHHSVPFEESAEHLRYSTRESRERPESLNIYKEEISDVAGEENFHFEQNFDDESNNQLIESDLKDETEITEIDNNLNDNSAEVANMEALEIQDENSQDKLDGENAPDSDALSKENEGRLATGQLDLKFYHSPLW